VLLVLAAGFQQVIVAQSSTPDTTQTSAPLETSSLSPQEANSTGQKVAAEKSAASIPTPTVEPATTGDPSEPRKTASAAMATPIESNGTPSKDASPATGKREVAVPAKYDVSQIGHRNVGSGLDFYSLDREVALGRQLSQEVEESARLVSDPQITEYINRIGQNLVRNSDARVPFTIEVLDTDEVNAFALPGGFFYVNSGLILAADNEAELAGVMAHEIAHVAARHATKNMTRAQIWNMASVPLIFVGGPVAYIVSEVAGLAVPLGFLKFSRDAEREADLLGLEYDYATGYDPEAFVQFFEKLKMNDGKKKQNLVAKAFATHPMNADRVKAAQDEIRKYLPDRPEYVVDTSEFESMKQRLIMLENGRRLGGSKGDSNRPVLLKRTSSSGSTDSTGSDNTKNDGRPTLKRQPSSD
jgi:predicted Zn-dependent protease